LKIIIIATVYYPNVILDNIDQSQYNWRSA